MALLTAEHLGQLSDIGIFQPSGLNDDKRLQAVGSPFFAVDKGYAEEIDDAMRASRVKTTGGFLAEIAIVDASQLSNSAELVEEAVRNRQNNYLSLRNPNRLEVVPKSVVTQLELRGDGEKRAMVISQEFDAAHQPVGDPDIKPSFIQVLNRTPRNFARDVSGSVVGLERPKLCVAEFAEEFKQPIESWQIQREPLVNRQDTLRYAESVVRTYMVLANMAVAQFAFRHDVPILYRTFDPAGRFKQAMYSVIPLRHKFLSSYPVPIYSHYTSPLRRASDLVNHLQIGRFLAGEDLIFDRKALSGIAQHLSSPR